MPSGGMPEPVCQLDSEVRARRDHSATPLTAQPEARARWTRNRPRFGRRERARSRPVRARRRPARHRGHAAHRGDPTVDRPRFGAAAKALSKPVQKSGISKARGSLARSSCLEMHRTWISKPVLLKPVEQGGQWPQNVVPGTAVQKEELFVSRHHIERSQGHVSSSVRIGRIRGPPFMNVASHPSSRWNRCVDGLYCHDRKRPWSGQMHRNGR